MNDWLEKRLTKLSTFESYKKPEKIVNAIKLDSNENKVLGKRLSTNFAIQSAKNIDLREYPMEHLDIFYDKLQKYCNIDKKYLAVGNGSDQIIDLILSVVGKNQEMTTFVPTFTYVINRCQLYDIKVNSIFLDIKDNSLNKKKFIKTAKNSNIIYICSPNNPTGNQFDEETVKEIIDNLKNKLIILDEAYVEFGKYSMSKNIIDLENVVILRTFSKAFGLAGARIGYLISNEKFANIFKKTIQSPYPVNSISLSIASKMLAKSKCVMKVVEDIKKEREQLFKKIVDIKSLKVYESDANFIFIQAGNKYDSILKELKKERMIVKEFGNIGQRKGCLRYTIGTKEMNEKFSIIIENIK